MSDIFHYALRNKLRFKVQRGTITTEQLWDLPLNSRTGDSLESVARDLYAEISSLPAVPFTTTAPVTQTHAERRLEVVKAVIADKQKEASARAEATLRAQEVERLRDALAQKKGEALASMSIEEIEARLKELREGNES